MKKKYFLTIDDEFVEYCELNNIEDVEKFANETFKRGFVIVKYGNMPPKEVTLLPLKETKERIKTDPQHTRQFAEEIMPVIPMNPPDRTGLLSKMDKTSDIYDE